MKMTQHRFATKKMKAVLTTLCILMTSSAISCHSAEKTDYIKTGIDIISAACLGTIRIEALYGFSEKWSVGSEIGINLKAMKTYTEDIGTIHKNDLEEQIKPIATDRFRQVFQEISLSIQYWPVKMFSGPFIHVGMTHKDRDRPDCFTGMGYSIHIWKDLGLTLMYRLMIMDAIKKRNISAEGIRIGINYIF